MIQLDVHTHTIASGHAYNTILEMAHEAARKGLRILGITEHAPNIPGACDPIYFRNLHVVPRTIEGVRLLLGAELNILDTNGTLDLDPWYYQHCLDLRIAGIHRLCWQGGTQEQNTHAMVQAIANPWVHIISHPGDGTADLDFEAVVLAAKQHNTLLEINNSSFIPRRGLNASHDNYRRILQLCLRHDVPVILGSDAHFCTDIANYKYVLPLLDELQFPERLVANHQPEQFLEFVFGKTDKAIAAS